jgi:hypothetical protein
MTMTKLLAGVNTLLVAAIFFILCDTLPNWRGAVVFMVVVSIYSFSFMEGFYIGQQNPEDSE